MLTLGGGIDRKAIPTRGIDPSAKVPNRFLLQTAPLAAAAYQSALAHSTLGN